MKKIIQLTLILLLVACSPSAYPPLDDNKPTSDESNPADKQPAETHASYPTTPLAFDQLDLQSIAIQDGDLPEGFTAGLVLDSLPKIFAEIPPPQRSFYQILLRKDNAAGGVAILLYATRQDSDRAYEQLHQGMGIDESEPVDGIGERAHIYIFYQAGIAFRFVDLLFQRCEAVVHIRFGETSEKNPIIYYAQKVDQSLSGAICR